MEKAVREKVNYFAPGSDGLHVYVHQIDKPFFLSADSSFGIMKKALQVDIDIEAVPPTCEVIHLNRDNVEQADIDVRPATPDESRHLARVILEDYGIAAPGLNTLLLAVL